MSIIFEVLKEEKERLDALSKRYSMEIARLPKGAFIIKDRNGKKFAYLNYREKSAVRSKYLGADNAPKVKDMGVKIKRRQEIESWLKDVKSDLKVLNKVLVHDERRKNEPVS